VAPDNRWTRRYRAHDHEHPEPREAEWLSGCALALRREAFDAVGGFDPGYQLYVEDLDLGVRLRAAGWGLRFQPEASVEHRVGASTSRARGRALISHARSLDRYLKQQGGVAARLARPLWWLGLAGWVVATWSWERTFGRHQSPTGESQHDAGRGAMT
jgi:N-acetylglucosaminyl-diphospho-decaprenol L-rhamnosyltransferase